jgi:hypothetical protein
MTKAQKIKIICLFTGFLAAFIAQHHLFLGIAVALISVAVSLYTWWNE